MKKYALITDCHTGSAVPLVKQLLDGGDRVDLIVLTHGKPDLLEAVDLDFRPKHHGLSDVPAKAYPALAAWLGHGDRFRFRVADTPRTFAKVPVLRSLLAPLRAAWIRRICRRVCEEQYDAVNFIGRYNQEDLLRYLSGLGGRTVVSLHEVCDHADPDFAHPNEALRYLFAAGLPITVYSPKSRDDLLRYRGCPAQNVHLIPFGAFSSYRIFDGADGLDLPERYGLMIGWIAPYKGLGVLAEAVRQTKTEGFRYVIAGDGKDPAIASLEADDRFVVMNWFLSNSEFAELIRRSAFVICPYRSASQSGVPQTAFVYGRPVVASDLGSFRSVVAPGFNGELFPAGDAAALAAILDRLAADPGALPALQAGAAGFESRFPEYAWSAIASRFREVTSLVQSCL